MATAMYGTQQSYANTTVNHNNTQQQPLAGEEQYITTFFCRALYDYQTQDSSSLSFRKDEVIEVLTRLESGWWDGLLGEERGWFPSNYVTVISDEQAEAALFGSEYSTQQYSASGSTQGGSSSTVTGGRSIANGSGWADGDIGHSDSRNGLVELANAALEDDSIPYSDFWMPQVTPEGAVRARSLFFVVTADLNLWFQIYYVNTQTGEISRDLPMENDREPADNELAGLTSSQASSRAGTGAALGLNPVSPIVAGFGLSKNAEVPDPWVRKLADDGMTYYFTNRETGESRWTAPEFDPLSSRQDRTTRSRATTQSSITSSNNQQGPLAAAQRLRSESSVSMARQKSGSSADRLSLYSDESDNLLMDRQRNGSVSTQHSASNGLNSTGWDEIASPERIVNAAVELTSAEQTAQSLQQALAPRTPESLSDLSSTARQTIIAVIESVQANDISRFLEEDTTLDNLVYSAVLAIRNLLYVSAAPSGHIPSSVVPGPRDIRDRRDTTASQALLKPAQRKVTATLSKLVLSARAIQYNAGSSVNDTPMRIEGDAEELERAVAAFVMEVERSQSQQLHSTAGLKRLRGVFSTANIGLGLVGAGAAGSWKGLGWVSLEDADEAPARVLGTEIVAEMRTRTSWVDETFSTFGLSFREFANQSGMPFFVY